MHRAVWAIAITLVVLLVAVTTANVWPALWQTISSFLYDYRWWWALPAALAVAVLLLWLVVRLLQRPWGAPWRAHVLASADALQYQLDALLAGATPTQPELTCSIAQAVRHHLEVAPKAAWPEDDKRLPVAEQFLDWWTGAPIEAAYVNLHEAEIALAQLLPDDQIQARIPEALARLQTMEVTDPGAGRPRPSWPRLHPCRRTNAGPRSRPRSGSAWSSKTRRTSASAASATSS